MNTQVIDFSKTATLIHVNDPFNVSDQTRDIVPLSEGVKVGELISADILEGHAVSINGELLEEGREDRVVLEGDYIVLCPVPAGGGGGGKNVLRLVALVAVAVAAPYIAGALGGALGFASGSLAFYAVSAGISIAGSLLVNALIPVEQSLPRSKEMKSDSDSPSYGVDGPKNTAREGTAVPMVYGRHRVAGNFISTYAQPYGGGSDDQDLRALLALSEGPIGAVDIDTIEINDQPIANFDHVETDIRLGLNDQDPMQWFMDNYVVRPVSATLSDSYTTFTTNENLDGVRIDIVGPLGFRTINDNGSSTYFNQPITIQYRKAGTSTWATLNHDRYVNGETTEYVYTHDSDGNEYPTPVVRTSLTYGTLTKGTIRHNTTVKVSWKGSTEERTRTITVGYTRKVPTYSTKTGISGKSSSPIRRFFYISFPETGQYDVRVKRDNPENTSDDQIIDKLVWTEINEMTYPAVAHVNTALLGVKIRMSDQLSRRPNITVEIDGIQVRQPLIAVGQGSGWTRATSSNPAWIALDMLTNKRYGAGYSDIRIDFYSLVEWGNYCDEVGLEFNGVFDVDVNFWDALSHVLRAGRAKIIPQGIKFGFAVEKASAPRMLFNVSNIEKSSLQIHWLPMADRANEVQVTYYDRENGYRSTVLKVVDPAAQNNKQPRSISLDLVGVTSAEQARDEGRLLLNLNRLIQQTITFSAPVEAISCKVGEVVLVQHDIPKWGEGGRTKAGSTATQLQLDRPVFMEAGKNYAVLLSYDNLLVSTGTVVGVGSGYIRLSETSFVGGNLIAVINGVEYPCGSAFMDGSYLGVSIEDTAGISASDAYELYQVEALIEKDVTNQPGDQEVITLTSALPQAPGAFVKWIFGEKQFGQKPFRIMNISGEGVESRSITAMEYNEAAYNDDYVVGEPPVYTPPPVVRHVYDLSVTQVKKVIGDTISPTIRLEWTAHTEYKGADVFVRRFEEWEFIGTVLDQQRSFEYADGIVGETLHFKVAARGTLGDRAPITTAPEVTIVVTASGDIIEPPSNVDCEFTPDGILLTWDNPTAQNFKTVEIYRSNTNDSNTAIRIASTPGESYQDTKITAGLTYYYWFRTVNTDGSPGIFSASVTTPALTQLQNLRLKSPFVGSAAEITWDAPSFAAEYVVRVRTKGVVRRTETVRVNQYRYGIEDAIADGDVDRDITFEVWAKTVTGQNSPSRSLAVSNPAPALPGSLSVLAGFKTITINFLPPTDPDYVDTVIWVSETQGFTPDQSTMVASVAGGPITITGADDNTDYYIRMTSRDAWGMGTISAEYNARTMQVSDLDGLSPWAFVTQVDRDFIDQYMADDAIESTKIKSVTASRITTGTLAATEKVSVEGQIESVSGSITVTTGPKLVGSKVALFSAMNGAVPIFTVNEDGTATFSGAVTITGGSGYANLADRPTSLSDISAADAQALADAAQNAQDALDAVQNGVITTFYQPSAPASVDSREGDLWFDTDNGNKLHRFNGVSWVATDDSRIADAVNAAQTAQTTADGKAKTFFQTTVPAAGDVSTGDLWYNGNTKLLRRWNGSAWQDVANAFNNTNQLTDGAGLGQSAVWANVSGSGKPADNADVTNYADVRVANAIQSENVTTIPAPVGARYSGPASITGGIKVTLPQGYTNTMMYFTVNVYDYQENKSFSLQLGGYNHTNGWVRCSARLIGSADLNNTVWFGHDGSKCFVIIGSETSVWTHVKVSVTNFQAGYTNYSPGQWDDGWSISVVSTFPSNIDKIISDTLIDARSILGQGALATQDSVNYNDVAGTKPPANATRGADWNSTLFNIPDRITDNATVGLNLTNTYLGYFDGTSWGTHIKNDGSFFFGDYNEGQYLDFNGSVLQLGPNTSIGSNENRQVTVGPGGQFSSLNQALEFLSKTVPAYKNGGFTCELVLLSGLVITEGTHFKGVDLSWITITSSHQITATLPAGVAYVFTATHGARTPSLDFSIKINSDRSFLDVDGGATVATIGSNFAMDSGATTAIRATNGASIVAGDIVLSNTFDSFNYGNITIGAGATLNAAQVNTPKGTVSVTGGTITCSSVTANNITAASGARFATGTATIGSTVSVSRLGVMRIGGNLSAAYLFTDAGTLEVNGSATITRTGLNRAVEISNGSNVMFGSGNITSASDNTVWIYEASRLNVEGSLVITHQGQGGSAYGALLVTDGSTITCNAVEIYTAYRGMTFKASEGHFTVGIFFESGPSLGSPVTLEGGSIVRTGYGPSANIAANTFTANGIYFLY